MTKQTKPRTLIRKLRMENEYLGNITFDKPQRQSRIGIFVEFVYTFQRTARAFWPALLYVIIRAKDLSFFHIGIGAVLLLTTIAVVAYLKYLNFVFHIDASREEFILHHGILNKKRVVVQLSRIQQININQSLIQKLVGVYAVEIETAGSAKSEATIKAIAQPLAEALKARLLDTSSGGATDNRASEEIATTSQRPFINIRLRNLAKVGITSNYMESFTLLLAFIYTMYSNAKEVWLNDENQENRLQDFMSSSVLVQSLLIVFAMLMLITLLINIIRIIVPYFGFNISMQGRSLLMSYGLLNSKNTILHPHKVQVVKLITNYFQRKINVLRMVARQASSDIQADKKANIQIPGCSVRESETILKLIFGLLPQKGQVLKPNIRRIISSTGIFILIPISIFMVLAWINPVIHQYSFILPVYLVLAGISIYFSYQNNRLFVNEGFIIKQYGIWDVHTEIIEPFKIQSITTQQNFWHRQANIGHLTLHTAGGDITFRFADFSTVNTLVDTWLYQVETSKKEWM